jgi:MFS family permease
LECINNESELNDDTGCCWQAEEETTSISSIWSRRNTRNHLISYWLYSFVVIAIDEAFPLYCISRNNNGIGQLSESDIGTILSIAGLIFAVGQFHIYTWIVNRFGVYGSLTFGCWAGVLPISLIPCAALVAHFSSRLGVVMYIALLMGMTKIFQSAFFSGITVATNRTVPKEMRSSMNGFGGMGAGGAKALGPLFVGFWMSICLSWDGNAMLNGGIIAWLGLASLSLPIFFHLQTLEHLDI